MNQIFEFGFKLLHLITYPLTSLIINNSRRSRVLILFENEVLLQRSSFGRQRWSLPGGGAKRGESIVDSAVREVSEETGIKLDPIKLQKIANIYKPVGYGGGWPRAEITTFAISLPQKIEIKISRPFEVLEAKWFSLTSLDSLTISETVTEALGQLGKLKNY